MKITQDMLDVMISDHAAWLEKGAVLDVTYLINKDLSGLTFRGAHLKYAVLRNCDLRGCDISSCNLCSSDLSGSDLRGADLQDTQMRHCALDGALLDPVSGPLREFYQELQDWIVEGYKKHRTFKKDVAICDALKRWSCSDSSLMLENERQFAVRGLDTGFPFNVVHGWLREQQCSTFYENPRRLAFIKEMAE
ncbi:pentapeptide repeat-containing protein [Lonsdalea quercina]|uniref:pentapeptide repeat-containing protein n=1 Tax=Lonsdalea quercina TaxID=71657 RepID=UPI0039750E49